MSFLRHIPNTITTLNLAAGIVGVVFAFEGRSDVAFYMMLLAAVFDFCDGLAARALKAYSPMGKELDSLCDMVSFGVLPSVMMLDNMRAYVWTSVDWLAFIPLIFSIGTALRLAKFNVDERQKSSFRGLAAPAGAICVASLCCYADMEPNSVLGALCSYAWFLPLVSLLMVSLMLCDVPMFSFKISRDDSAEIKSRRAFFLVDCLVILLGTLLVRTSWMIAVFLSVLLYIVKNFFFLLPLRRK